MFSGEQTILTGAWDFSIAHWLQRRRSCGSILIRRKDRQKSTLYLWYQNSQTFKALLPLFSKFLHMKLQNMWMMSISSEVIRRLICSVLLFTEIGHKLGAFPPNLTHWCFSDHLCQSIHIISPTSFKGINFAVIWTKLIWIGWKTYKLTSFYPRNWFCSFPRVVLYQKQQPIEWTLAVDPKEKEKTSQKIMNLSDIPTFS